MKIYLAILEDRHVDIVIVPYHWLNDARKRVIDWQSDYPDETWVERDIEGWEYYVHSGDDDGRPNIRIEKRELRW